jgi:hypothetical protein
MPGDKRVAGYGNTIPYEAAYFVPACAPPRTRSGTWRRVTVPDAVSIGKSCYGTAREAALGLSWRHVPRHACCSPHGQPETPAKAIAARVEGDAHDGQVDTGAAFRLPLDYRTQLSATLARSASTSPAHSQRCPRCALCGRSLIAAARAWILVTLPIGSPPMFFVQLARDP